MNKIPIEWLLGLPFVGAILTAIANKILNRKKEGLELDSSSIDFMQKIQQFKDAELEKVLENFEKLKAKESEREEYLEKLEVQLSKCRKLLRKHNIPFDE